jgi:hypothetical protein
MNPQELYFIWDYELPPAQFVAILKDEKHPQNPWLVGRILQYARWEDIWRYLNVAQIKKTLPKLQIRPQLKRCWEIAIARWTNA